MSSVTTAPPRKMADAADFRPAEYAEDFQFALDERLDIQPVGRGAAAIRRAAALAHEYEREDLDKACSAHSSAPIGLPFRLSLAWQLSRLGRSLCCLYIRSYGLGVLNRRLGCRCGYDVDRLPSEPFALLLFCHVASSVSSRQPAALPACQRVNPADRSLRSAGALTPAIRPV